VESARQIEQTGAIGDEIAVSECIASAGRDVPLKSSRNDPAIARPAPVPVRVRNVRRSRVMATWLDAEW
jgi:hypothetical protein